MSLSIHTGNLTLTTVLWFHSQAQEAANFYISIFPNSKILRSQRYSEASKEIHGQEPGSILFVEFELDGHRFSGLNGGPHVNFNHAVSFMVDCADQKEVDYYWGKLTEGGDVRKQECGWLADKFGVSWQVVPKRLKEMLISEDVAAAGRALMAMMTMKKLDIKGLEKAFKGEE
ncbi:3-demethylubiquinone-9 3-methyltransferase-domain-containing protein [Triangularia setosa]|uniref:3-demethylubiquinone-9 3-methyltransferase-domain-containing protein n=1 Tax=Triangularia setosa TaxID=2587417 RepID=A0AAN6VZI4_9PEZI|nr:3-demethylubiquinone-9 3-methyltransferase-domain-containing protein [Podospora setosa]